MQFDYRTEFTVKNENIETQTIQHPDGSVETSERRTYRSTLEFIVDRLTGAGIIGVVIIGTICLIIGFQAIRGKDINVVPGPLWALAGGAAGFYFGQRKSHDQGGEEENRTPIGFKSKPKSK